MFKLLNLTHRPRRAQNLSDRIGILIAQSKTVPRRFPVVVENDKIVPAVAMGHNADTASSAKLDLLATPMPGSTPLMIATVINVSLASQESASALTRLAATISMPGKVSAERQSGAAATSAMARLALGSRIRLACLRQRKSCQITPSARPRLPAVSARNDGSRAACSAVEHRLTVPT
jgi:hypothetical protein